MKDYLSASVSYFDIGKQHDENIYHVLMLGLLAGLKNQYHIDSNLESGEGRFDICLMPKDTTEHGIVLEFKKTTDAELLATTAIKATNQIREKCYESRLKQAGIQKALGIGIAFSGQQVAAHSIEL